LDTKINYTFVGLVVVSLMALLISLLLWWTHSFNRQVYKTYLVYMDQDVSGLAVQGPVKYNGVPVGVISKMMLNTDNPQEVILYLHIIPSAPITTSTIATLSSQGITGVPYINLDTKTPNAPPLTAAPGQPYPVIPSEPSLMLQVLQTVNQAAQNFAQVSQSLKVMFDAQNAQNFKKILTNLSAASEQMPAMVSQVQQSAQQVSTLTANVNQAVPSALQLLDRLNQISGNLDTVTSEMKQNPAVLIRGTTTSNLGPGEQP
jgi:phospholipid/cholesterol/gamma-HCH transport system substrate-binding protein